MVSIPFFTNPKYGLFKGSKRHPWCKPSFLLRLPDDTVHTGRNQGYEIAENRMDKGSERAVLCKI